MMSKVVKRETAGIGDEKETNSDEKHLLTSIFIDHFEGGDGVDTHPDCRDHHKHH